MSRLPRATVLKAYPELAAVRGERCWICGRPRRGRRLHVDHDHKTGRIRGLLCYLCNRGLRWFRDNPTLFRKAADYLEQKPA